MVGQCLGNVSAGQIFTGSGVDEVIITGSLLGSATVRLDNSGSSGNPQTASLSVTSEVVTLW